MKKLFVFLSMAIMTFAMVFSSVACGGGGDEVVNVTPAPTKPNNPDNSNKPDNTDNSGTTVDETPTDNELVRQTCPLCLGTRNCKTCGGSGKGCKTCGGTGMSCSYCGGTGKCDCGDGKCSKCNGKGVETCDYCWGTDKCWICGGLGWYLRSDNTCSACKGTGSCTNRNCVGGKVKCSRCGGDGECDDCHGDMKCRYCHGNPSCKTCGGDGHCATCLNSDGKCTQCHGDGFVLVDLILNPTTLELTNYGGSKDVSITIDGKWTATCKESWIKLSNAEGKGNGKFTVEAETNPSETSRTAIVTISFGIGKTASYYVNQAATIFNASIRSNRFTYEGGSTTLSVKATETISWTLSRSDNWVYLGKNANYQNDYSGKGNADVEIFVGMNANTESRSAVIALKSDFGTKEIAISQSGMEDKVEAKMSSSTIKADGGSELLSIAAPSSREWKIASKDSWVHFDVESGSGIKSVKVTVDKNEGYYQRSTDITVTSAGVPSKTITITQEPQKMYMTLKTSVQAFTCDENKFTISVTTIPSYLKWTAKKTETWIHFDSKWNNSSQFSYDGTYTLNVYVDENTTFSGRQASITFTSEAGTETVNITQGGRSKPNTNTTLGKMLIYPFGTVNLDMSDATYSQIKSTLGNLYRLESNSGYFFLSQDKNQSLSSYSYRGIPFYRMYVSDNKNDVQICYTFKTGSISDPGAMYDLIVEDFKEIGIPLKVSQMSNSWVKGTYETAFAKFVAEIKYSSYPAGWDYTIEVDYIK